jgi:hypothetical protein
VSDSKQDPFLFVATPMYGGMCHGTFAVSMIRMVNVFTEAKMGFTFAYMMNESLITRARDSLAKDFLETPCTHLMFIDSDIGFNPQDIVGMVGADKDVICGLYPKKEINWVQVSEAAKAGVEPQQLHNYTGAFVMNAVDYNAKEVRGVIGEPMEISNGGTGFMLIKRKVFEKLSDTVPEYNSDMYHIVDTERKPRVIKQFFATSIDKESGNRLLSEDYHFCKIAREAGFRVYAAPWASLSHTGSYTFSGYLPREKNT